MVVITVSNYQSSSNYWAGRIAQMAQSACLTSRRSQVRILFRPSDLGHKGLFFTHFACRGALTPPATDCYTNSVQASRGYLCRKEAVTAGP